MYCMLPLVWCNSYLWYETSLHNRRILMGMSRCDQSQGRGCISIKSTVTIFNKAKGHAKFFTTSDWKHSSTIGKGPRTPPSWAALGLCHSKDSNLPVLLYLYFKELLRKCGIVTYLLLHCNRVAEWRNWPIYMTTTDHLLLQSTAVYWILHIC